MLTVVPYVKDVVGAVVVYIDRNQTIVKIPGERQRLAAGTNNRRDRRHAAFDIVCDALAGRRVGRSGVEC